MRPGCLGMIILALLLLAIATLARAQTQPSQPADSNVSVLLLPFAELDRNGGMDWVGPAVQQNLLNELTRQPRIVPKTAPAGAQSPVDLDGAQKAGETADTGLVIFGTYQATETELRLTGQVLETRTGKLLGSLKATGPIRDLFALEDDVAGQARRLIEKHLGSATAPRPFTPIVPEPAKEVLTAQSAPPPQAPFPWQSDQAWIERMWGWTPHLDDAYAASQYRYWYGNRSSFGYGLAYDYGYYSPYYSPYGSGYGFGYGTSWQGTGLSTGRRYSESTSFGFRGSYHGRHGHVTVQGGR